MDKREKMEEEIFMGKREDEVEIRSEFEIIPNEDMNMESTEDIDLVFKLKKPFVFEGKEYTEIDLSGLEDMKTNDMIAVNNIIKRKQQGMGMDAMPELTLEYACYLASKATNLPIELFMALPAREAMKIKGRVMSFLF